MGALWRKLHHHGEQDSSLLSVHKCNVAGIYNIGWALFGNYFLHMMDNDYGKQDG